jgi:hypothetical protein
MVGVLLCPIVSIIMDVNVQGAGSEGSTVITKKIGVNEGIYFKNSYTLHAIKPLDDYSWIVENCIYNFSTSLMDIDYVKDMEEPYEYDVLIFDGGTDEVPKCSDLGYVLPPTDATPEDIKDKLETFIQKGYGYIGKCGGGLLPATNDNPEPDNIRAYYFINTNSFLRERSDIKVRVKFGEVGTSQFIGMEYEDLGLPRLL